MYNTQLETFITVADEGSFSKASEKLFISPTAVIKQINSLEDRIGIELFKRTHRGLKLTEAGEKFYKEAKYIIKYSKKAVNKIRSENRKTQNIIRIGTSPITPESNLIELWSKIKKHDNNLRLELIPFDNNPEEARGILKNLGENIDIVVGIYDLPFLRSRECAATKLKDADINCSIPITHRLSEKDEITMDDLKYETVFLIERGYFKGMDAVRNEIEKNYKEISIEDFGFFNLLIFNKCENENKILITVDNNFNVHPLMKSVKVKWNFKIEYGILHSPNPNKTIKNFLKLVKKVKDEI